MILEALNYAATFLLTPPEFRPHIRSSVSLWSRARRQAIAWRAHEAACHDAVAAAIAPLRQRRTAVVLGSGLLRDVPIRTLARAFDTVVLVDLVHLASVRAWLAANRPGAVRLIHRDLSGLAGLQAGAAPDPLGFLRDVPYLDFVLSANVLSQIGRGLRRRMDADPGLPADAAARSIAAHIEALRGAPFATCLLTDISYAVIDRTGRLHEEADLLEGCFAPPARAEWQWPVAPLGEESKDYQILHKVIVIY